MKKNFLSRTSFFISLLFTLTLILPSVNPVKASAAVTPKSDVKTSEKTASAVPTSDDKTSLNTKKANQIAANSTGTMLPPSNLSSSNPTPNSAKLTWSSVYGATGYNIYEITEGQLTLIGKATTNSYSINNLSEGSHSYVVSTLSSEEESGPCAPVVVDIVYPNMVAPATLTSTIKNGNDIVLNWTSSSYGESYKLYAVTEDGEKTLITSTSSLTYTITNLPEGNYKYAVSSVNSVYGESSISTPLQVSVVFPKIIAPTNLIYKVTNGSTITLNWTSVSYATSYEVYEVIDDQEILKSTVTSPTVTLTNSKVGEHKYVVYAVNTRFGKSVGSNISALVAPQTMQAPGNLTYTITNSTNIALKWSAVTYATGYNIYRVVDGNKVLVSQVTGTSVSYTNLPAGDYVYEVHSYSDIFGESVNGSQVSASSGLKMEAPSNFSYKINNGNDIVLTWDSVPNATQYKVYAIKNGTKTLQSTITGTTVTYTNMTAGDYSYEVDSYSTSYGDSPTGSQISFTLEYPQMQAPDDLTHTTVSATSFNLSWHSVPYATNYKIYQIVNGTKVLKNTTSSTNITFTNMAPGDYSYEVYSYSNKFGDSPKGSSLTFTLVGEEVKPPTNLTYSIDNINNVTLKWTAANYATCYNIYQIIDGQKSLVKMATGTSATFTNLPEGNYHYVVTSVSSLLGESPTGAEATFSIDYPTMTAPSNLAYTIKDVNTVVLSWASSSNATSYNVYELIDGKEVIKATVTSLSATFTNVPAGNHTYIVHSVSSRFGESKDGSKTSLDLAETIMAPPGNLAYSIANGNDLTLKWSPSTYATSYNIYQVVDGEKTLVKTVTGTVITFTNMPAGDYHYIVTSVSSRFGESPTGSELSFNLAQTVMAPPTNLAYSLANVNDITLKWSASTYAASYNIYQVVDGQKNLVKNVTGTSVTFTNMPTGDYHYIVTSVGSRFGESPTGSELSFNLAQPVMAPPTNLAYSLSNVNDVTLKWSASTYATSYNIYQIVDGQKNLVKTVTSTSVTFTSMTAGDYDYIVTSVSSRFGESPTVSELSFKLTETVMAPPPNLAYSLSNVNDITLKWSASTYATSYNIYQVVDGKKNLVKNVTSTSVTFTNMPAGDYDYIVTSVSSRFGESPTGSELSFNLAQTVMIPPTNLAYSLANGNDLTLKWSPSTYATSYNIYQVVDGKKTLVKNITSTSITLTNMPDGDYNYIVTSVSSRFGESPTGSELSFNLAKTIMIPPADLSYSLANGNDLTLKWSPSTYAASYNIYKVVDGKKTLVKNVTGTSTTFTNMPAGDYDYVVTSVSSRFGESPTGSELPFNLPQIIMQSPTNLAYSIANGNDLTLKWSASTYATSYNIYQVVDGQKTLIKSTTSTSITFTNMPAKTYNYIVTSVSPRFGESPVGSELSFDLPQVIMQSPTNLAYSIANGNDLTLKWSASTYATSYNIYQVVDGQKTLVKSTTGTTITLTNMPAGDYNYVVTSLSTRFGESPTGSTLSFTLDWPIVQAPTVTNTVTNINNITLSWKSTSWANKYRVYEVVGDTRNLLYEGTALSYQVYNISEGTHNYEVTAYNTRFGESAPSNRISETVVFPIMAAPIANIKLLDGTSALIYWNFITYANGYNVYEIVDGTPVLLTKDLNNLSYKLTNLPYRDHEYYVTSVSNSFGESEKSNVVVAKLIVDTEAPTTSSDAPENWTNKTPLVVNLSSSDNMTGVDKTYYSINDGDFVEGNSFVINEEGTNKISFYSVDKVGNKEAVKTSYVKIDKTAPITSASVSNEWHANDVTVNLNASDNESGVSKTFYSIDGSDYVEGSSFTISDEGKHKVSFYSVDNAGNFEGAKTVDVNEDKTAPVTSSDVTNGWSKDDVTVNLTATDNGSGAYKTFYSIDGTAYVEGTSFTVSGEGNHKVSFYSVDNAGNSEEPKTVDVNQDKTAPVTSSDVTKGWYKGDVTVNLTATDNGSGVAKTFYSIDGAEYVEGSSFTISSEGNHKVSFYSVDNAGNSEEPKTVDVSQDKTAPVTSSDVTSGWFKDDVTVNLTATDNGSGVSKTFYSIDGAAYTEGSSFTVSGEGNHKVSFYSVDNAGNSEEPKTVDVNQDKTAPVTSSDVTNGWFKDDVTVNLTATDNGSGVSKTFYSIDGSDYTEGTSFIVSGEGNHKVSFYSVDNAGTSEEPKTVDVNLDKTAPVTSSDVTNGWYKGDVTINLTATDNGSGIAKTFYSIDGAAYVEGTSFTASGEGNHKVSFYSVDNAGNSEEPKTVDVNEDKTAPVTSSDVTSTWFKNDVTVNLTATDNGSGVAKTFYSIDGADYTEGTSFIVSGEGTHKISFYSVDNAGNSEEPKTVDVNEDKTAPVTSSDLANGWYKGDVTVNLTATDSGGGIAKTFYSIDGAAYVEGTSFIVSGEGTHKVSFYSVDNAGNSEEHKTVDVNEDKTAPVTSSDVTSGWFKNDVTVNLTATDNGSGVAKTFYSIDGSDYTEGTSFIVSGEGTHKISFYSVDNAGNSEEPKTVDVNEDKTAPVTSSDVTNRWSTDNVTVNLTATDSGSGIAKTFYSIDGSAYVEGTSFIVSGEGTHKVSFYSVDNAGNSEEPKTVEVNQDKTAPVTTSTVIRRCIFTYTIKLTATDAGSGVANTFYSVDGGAYVKGTSLTIDSIFNHKISFYSVDNAGNVETPKTIQLSLDKLPPLTLSDITCCWYNHDVPVNLVAIDIFSGVAKTFYSIDNSDYIEGDTFTVKGDGVHKVSYYSVDNVGNVEITKTQYIRIDKTAPITTSTTLKGCFKNSMLVNLSAVDNNGSGVMSTFYSVDGSCYIPGTSVPVIGAGTHKISYYSVDIAGNFEEPKTIYVKVDNKPDLSDKDIQVQSRDDNQQTQCSNTLYPRIKIKNLSDKEINLSDMQIKYFFTNEGNGESIFNCDWAGLNYNTVTGSVKGDFTRDNFGDTALKISFQSDKQIQPGQELEIQGRIHDPNWKTYNRFNDYSLNTACYSKNDRISVYYNNNKVCGTEPNLDTKDDDKITNKDFTLLSADANQQSQYTNTLCPRIKIKNISNKQIKFSDMKIKYFFTSDGSKQNAFACDYLAVNNCGISNNTKNDFTSDNSGNTTLTLSFNNDGKVFMPGDELEIQGRIYNMNWSLYNRFNDYSLNTKDYSPNDKVCLYVNGTNVNGVEP